MRASRKRDREDIITLALMWIPGVTRCPKCKGLHATGYVCPCGYDGGTGYELGHDEIEDLLVRAKR